MLGTDIEADARKMLVDADGVTWDDPFILAAINAGVSDIISHKPRANTVTGLLDLVAGAFQTLPATAIALVDIICNAGADGATLGRAITRTTAERMDAASPSWRSATGSAVKHFIYDERNPSAYEVWPGPTGATKVKARTCNHPTALTALGDAVPLDASYRNALVEFVLFRCYARDAENSLQSALATAHYAAYANTIGIQVQKQKSAGPGANSTVNPAHPVVEKNGA